jgi:hypothetical protein
MTKVQLINNAVYNTGMVYDRMYNDRMVHYCRPIKIVHQSLNVPRSTDKDSNLDTCGVTEEVIKQT